MVLLPLGSSITSPCSALLLCSRASALRSCARVRPCRALRLASLELTRGSKRSSRPEEVPFPPSAEPLPPEADAAEEDELEAADAWTPGESSAADDDAPGRGSTPVPVPDCPLVPGLVSASRPAPISYEPPDDAPSLGAELLYACESPLGCTNGINLSSLMC